MNSFQRRFNFATSFGFYLMYVLAGTAFVAAMIDLSGSAIRIWNGSKFVKPFYNQWVPYAVDILGEFFTGLGFGPMQAALATILGPTVVGVLVLICIGFLVQTVPWINRRVVKG